LPHHHRVHVLDPSAPHREAGQAHARGSALAAGGVHRHVEGEELGVKAQALGVLAGEGHDGSAGVDQEAHLGPVDLTLGPKVAVSSLGQLSIAHCLIQSGRIRGLRTAQGRRLRLD
jgi:hypothetical protein